MHEFLRTDTAQLEAGQLAFGEQRRDTLLGEAIAQAPRGGPAPRIWAGTVDDYLAGLPHGQWISAARKLREVEADVQAMLDRAPGSRTDRTNQWAVFASEGFDDDQPLTDPSLGRIVCRANEIRDRAGAFAAWDQLRPSDPDHHRLFQRTYQGRYDSLRDWVVLQVESACWDQLLDAVVPATMRSHVEINVDSLMHELEATDAVSVITDRERGGVWVFAPGTGEQGPT